MKTTSLVFVLAAALGGCAHKEARTDAKPATSTPPVTSSTATLTRTCSTDTDCGSKQICVRQQCVDVTADLAECSVVRVHFAFNASDIDAGDRPVLERSARCLKADHALHVTIEGSADERGTEEYNLALGDRRATSVAHYLEQLGASPVQVKTVSYGKENPLCTEHDEACWAQNRRAAVRPKETPKH